MKKEDTESLLNSSPLQHINGVYFTRREIDVLAFLIHGHLYKAIAPHLSISDKTVEHHVSNIMAKIGCNAKQSIINFCETSGADDSLREHYINLLNKGLFKKSLQQFAKIYNARGISCVIICPEKKQLQNPFITQLEHDLKLVGIVTSLKVQKPQRIERMYQDAFILYVIPHGLLVTEKGILTLQTNNKAFFLIEKIENLENIPEGLPYFSYHSLTNNRQYYELFFQIVEKMLPSHEWKKFIPQFKGNTENNQSHSIISSLAAPLEKKKISSKQKDVPKKSRLLKNKIVTFSFAITIFFICIAVCLYHVVSSKGQDNIIRAELHIPAESVLLDRRQLMDQIDQAFKNNGQGGIKAVALVGIGGAGKTTLARYYARRENAQAIWEINAETQESLKASFEKFAQHLASTEEDKKILREIQDIKTLSEKEEKILSFVQDHLRLHPNWLLVYDNVEKFLDIQKHFPQDVKVWGNGRIILTTRNSNIQNNSLVDNAIHIGKLSPKQKYDLFTKIMSHGSPSFNMTMQPMEISEFLKHIPPFPLDVSGAAYYLKTTHTHYTAYLENFIVYEQDFEKMQETLLKEVGDYNKTRYGIIAQSISYLINNNKDFCELCLLISLLNSQNISRELLNNYKNKIVVDNFIYNLNKYSLLTGTDCSTISIHRSTQKITLFFLNKLLNLKGNKKLLLAAAKFLENYAANVIEEEDITKMKLLISHYDVFINNYKNLTGNIHEGLGSTIGCLHTYFGSYPTSKKILEESLSAFKENNNKNEFLFSRLLLEIGVIYKEFSDYEKAKQFLTKSLAICRKHFPQDPATTAKVLANLGTVYTILGDYEKAKDYLEESFRIYTNDIPGNMKSCALLTELGIVYRRMGQFKKAEVLFKKSLLNYRNNFPDNHIKIAQNLEQLGNTYRNLGQYKKAKKFLEESLSTYKKYLPDTRPRIAQVLVSLGEVHRHLGHYEHAKQLLEKSLVIYKNSFSEDHADIAWASAYLGNIHRALGNYKKSKELIQKSVKTHLNLFGEDSIRTNWAMIFLAEIYKDLNNLKEAKSLLKKALIAYENHYGTDNTETARVLISLGEASLSANHLEGAENYLQKSRDIFQKENHSDIYIVLEDLSDLYKKKSNKAMERGHTKASQAFKTQSINYLKQALEIVKNHFPVDSPHIIRIQSKRQFCEKC